MWSHKFFPKWVKIKKEKKKMLLAGRSLCNLVFDAIAGESESDSSYHWHI